MPGAPVGKQRAVEGVVAPSEVQLRGLEAGLGKRQRAVERVVDGAGARITVVFHPVGRLLRAAAAVREELRALQRGAETDRLELRDRVTIIETRRDGLRTEIGRRGHELRDVAVGQRPGA